MNPARSLYRFFTSVRCAVVLIGVIILLTLLSTFIPQGRPEAWYQARYAPAVFQAVRTLHLASLFSSALFLVPVCLFTASLTLCTVDRFVRRARIMAPPRFGPDLVHVGLLVLIAGALVTGLGRQEATWPLAEGQEAGIGSGYTIRLVSFQFLRYDDGSPREWISTVDVSREGRPVAASFPIEVNHPLRLRGLTVYQSSWDVDGILRMKDSEGNVASPSPGDYFEQGESRWTFAAFQREGAAWTALFQRSRAGAQEETRILRPGDTIGPFTVTGISAREITGLKAVRDPGLAPFLVALLLVTVGMGLTLLQHGDDPQMMATIALILIVTAAVFQAGFLLRRENRRDPVSHWLLAAAALLLLATIADRSVRIRFAAITNTYESLVFFSAAICAVLFALRIARRTQGFSPFVMFGATIIALAFLAISSSPLAPHAIQPPIPALRSFWLVLHVTVSFIGEAFFVVSFIAAIGVLVTRKEERRAELDRLVAAAVGIGYPVFTAGALVFGAIWAETAWGAWWSWDPKENWALITWLLYTAYLHTRLVKRLRGRASAVLAIIGFAATVFTYFGVNFLLPGLHSYG